MNTLSLDDVLVACRLGSSSPFKMLIDSGADINVIGGRDCVRLKQEHLSGIAKLNIIKNSNKKNVLAYGTLTPMVVECLFESEIIAPDHYGRPTKAIFHVIRNGSRSLLGRSTASDMGLLHVTTTVNNVEGDGKTDVFPKMPQIKVRFSVDKNVPPVKNAYYNVPAAYREAAKLRLEQMERQGIIEKVTSAPNWISGMSAVAKGKNDFRLVVNMRAPNRAINREYFRLPLLDEMKVKLHGAKFFTKLDLSNAFYHLELHNESRDLTTFLTEDGM